MTRPVFICLLTVFGFLPTCGSPPPEEKGSPKAADTPFGEEAYQLLCRHIAAWEHPDDLGGVRGQALCSHTELTDLQAASPSRRLAHLVAARRDLISTFELVGQAASPNQLHGWLKKVLALEDAGHLSRWTDATADLLGALGQAPEFAHLFVTKGIEPELAETTPGLVSRFFRLRALPSLVQSWTAPPPAGGAGPSEPSEYSTIVSSLLRLEAEASDATREDWERIKSQLRIYLLEPTSLTPSDPKGPGGFGRPKPQNSRILEILSLLRSVLIESPDGIAASMLHLFREARPTSAGIASIFSRIEAVRRAPGIDQHLEKMKHLFFAHHDDIIFLLDRFLHALEGPHAAFPELKILAKAFEDLLPVLSDISREPGLLSRIIATFIEEDAGALGAHLARQMAYRDLIDYDLTAINGPRVGRLMTPVDRTARSTGENRSVWQRLLALVRATSELEICNEGLFAPLPHYAACSLFRVPDAARFYLQAMGGRAKLTLHLKPDDDFFPEQLAATQELSPGKTEMEAFTGIDGFCAAPLAYPFVPPALTFAVRPEAASRLMFALWDPRIDPQSDFGLGRPAAQLVSARTMTPEGPLDEVHRATLFAWEDPSFLRAVAPFLEPFLELGRDDLLVRILVVLDAYWSPSDNFAGPSFTSFEPMLIALLSDAAVMQAAQDIARSVRDAGVLSSIKSLSDVARGQNFSDLFSRQDLYDSLLKIVESNADEGRDVPSVESLIRHALQTALKFFRSRFLTGIIADETCALDVQSLTQIQAQKIDASKCLGAAILLLSGQHEELRDSWPKIISSFLRLAVASPERFFALSDALFELLTEEPEWLVSAVDRALAPAHDIPQMGMQKLARCLIDENMAPVMALGGALQVLGQTDAEGVLVAEMAALGRLLPNQSYTGLDVLTRVARAVVQEQTGRGSQSTLESVGEAAPDNLFLRAQTYILDLDRGLMRLLAVIQNKRVAID